ncbi:hypothetical protein [Psychrobacillus sp.]|uniref:hypothetical protein n=1 Tax=Psychrobacillus sp. TaxID=1871623 RepID=UPI0028BE0633|nr:hypothetical protein [Psychrobacillus sp.]
MKKIISYSLAIGIMGSTLFVPFSTTSAAALSKAEEAVKTAEGYAGALKWQISYENTKAIKTPDMKIFNETKSAYLQAKKEVSSASAAEKQKLEKRLADNVGLHYDRTMGYIDAITSGNKIVALTKTFEQQYAEDPTSDVAEKSYHALSAEIRKQAKLLYKVYGKTTRDAFLATYKAPAEILLNGAKYTISAKGDLNKLDALIAKKAAPEAIEKQVNQLFDSLDMIVEDDIYYVLFDKYGVAIRKDANFAEQEKEIKQFFITANGLYNSENVDGSFELYDPEFPDYDFVKEQMKEGFAEFDLKFELVDSNVYSILDGYAFVETTDKITEAGYSETVTTVYLLKKVDGKWKYADVLDLY